MQTLIFMKAYQHIFFDLDHTLWDFERASEETIIELVDKYQLHIHASVPHFEFVKAFRKVNQELWEKYNEGEISKDKIRKNRFKLIFKLMDISADLLPSTISEEYLMLCPCKPHLLEGAQEILEYLSQKYSLHILTNGFDDVQGLKLKHSGIQHFFNCIITSESTGKTKPNIEIFNYALSVSSANHANSLMIGDNLNTDIEGAFRAGIDSVFYNPLGIKKSHKATLEIKSLNEIKALL